MQTESGMQLILLGGPPLKSETLMGLSIRRRQQDEASCVCAVCLSYHRHERCERGQSVTRQKKKKRKCLGRRLQKLPTPPLGC